MLATDPSKPRRLELILRQIDTLPTLPAIALRVLALTARDDSDARQIIELISADQALTARILALCRRADVGIRAEAATLDKAVVLLGFNAVRNAVLSLKVLEVFADPDAGPGQAESRNQKPEIAATGHFDRTAFWRHCLAVALAAEAVAAAHPGLPDLPPGEAFVAGLLHDIGKLALDFVLPKSFARVIELVDFNQGNIAEFERRIVGMDHHTAGKRLAEQWQLPHRLQDCIWLHGSPYDLLPRLEHRRLVGLVSLADLLARQAHLGYSGNFTFKDRPDALARALGLDPAKVAAATAHLHDALERRCELLGLNTPPSRELFLASIQDANQMLGRLNDALQRRGAAAARQAQLLDAVAAFHAAAVPGRSVQDVMGAVATSAISALGGGYYGLVYQPARGESWLICHYNAEGRAIHSQYVEPPRHTPDLAALDASQPATLNLMGLLPWLSDYLLEAQDLREVRLLPLGCGWGTAALLLHDRPTLPPWRELQALTHTWGASLAAAGQHDGARALGEELAQANRALADTQDRLLRSESLAHLGEMAAGAAHEMNNPLAVISGRAQLLASGLRPGAKEQQAAQTIVDQAQRLSDLITALRIFADPPKPRRQLVDLGALLQDTVKQLPHALDDPRHYKPIDVRVAGIPAPVMLDPHQISQALTELLLNALQALPKTGVHVTARLAPGTPGTPGTPAARTPGTAPGTAPGTTAQSPATHAPESFARTAAEPAFGGFSSTLGSAPEGSPSAPPEPAALTVEVADDGMGMDAYTLEHALDPFFSNKPAGRRVGMGLPRAQQLVAGHGGTIELRSTPGEGTVASMVLPVEAES